MTDIPYSPGNLLDMVDKSKLPPETAAPVRKALETPYSVEQWRADLQAMADGVSTGFDMLDDVGMHWLPGKMTAVLARPGGGKTAWLLEATCRHLEAHPESHALFLSWEEPLADVVTRLMQRADAMAQANRIMVENQFVFDRLHLFTETFRNFARFPDRTNALDAPRLQAAGHTVAKLLKRLHLIDGDDMGRNVRTVLQAAGAWMRETNAPRVGLVAVDYFQKLRSGVPGMQRLAELQDVADTLRRFAKGAALTGETDRDSIDPHFAVPVLVGAQVNRYAAMSATEGSGHPTGDQIREGDDLLNDAANVIALSWEDASSTGTQDPKRWLRISVPKHRGGRTRGVSAEEVARLQWHPARQWMAPKCVHTISGVDWSTPKSATTVDSAPVDPLSIEKVLAHREKRGRT